MFYRDKLYDYKKFCERITLVKSKCNPPPPPEYQFLKDRRKKKEMEAEKKKDIEYTKNLLLNKYKFMYKNHNKYHPSNLKFQPRPSSLKLSQGRPQYYELCKNNKFMGNKIKEVQRSKGYYNCANSLRHYNKLKYIGDELAKSSKFNNNILLRLVTPFTYEKRLHKLFENQQWNKQKGKDDFIFYKTAARFNTDNFNNKMDRINRTDRSEYNPTAEDTKVNRIKIERENM